MDPDAQPIGSIRRFDQTGIPLLVARLILGVLFIWMGWNKVGDPVAFLKLIRQYEMVPDSAYVLLNVTAVTLPWIEVICGIALILGVLVRASALLLFLMLTAFTIAITLRALEIYQAENTPFCKIGFDCGCGTGVRYMCSKIPENVGLLFLSLFALWSRSRRFCLSGLLRRPRTEAHLARGQAETAWDR